MEMVEKVARAIATAHVRNGIDEFKEPAEWCNAADAYDLTNNNGRFEYDEMARAAIEAMREPTEEVAREAFNHVAGDDWLDFLRGHRAMISAALKEQEKVG